MARDSVSYDPLQFIAGSGEIRSTRVTVPAAHAAIPALTPLKRDVNYKAIPATALTDTIIGVVIPGPGSLDGALIGTTVDAADQFIHVYTDIELFGDQVDFTAIAAATDNLKKAGVFDRSGINLVFPDAGQV